MSNNNNNKYFIKLFYFLAGSPDKYDFKHRIFNISCLSSAFIGLTGTIINLTLGLDIITTVTTIFLFVFFMLIYFISVKYKKYKNLLHAYITLTFFIIISLWFSNDGSRGPTAFAFILLVFIFNLITEGLYRKIMNIIVFTSLLSLLLIEYNYPYLIQGYVNPNTRFFDYSFTILFEMLVMILISTYFVKSFYEDKKLTEQQRDEIQEKNEEITITQQELLKHKENLEELVQKRTIELENEKIKAETSDKLKTAFLSNMSHEIRTPMNAIISFSKLLKTNNINDDKKEEYLNIITDKGNLLLNIINDILDIAKIEANEINIKQEACNLNETLNEIHKSFLEELSNKKDIKFTVVSSPKNTVIKSDAARIKQIMLNLVSNAIKFTNKGEIKIGFTIEEIDRIKTIKLFVLDTGIGIPKDKINIVFDRFRQINETDAKDNRGTGLGLTISKNLANILGGNLSVKSELKQGSIFYFMLPYIKCKNNNTSNFNNDFSNYNWNNKKILIAEDEEFNYIILKDLLRYTKIDITRANDGQEVLDIIAKDANFDLILLDIQMPKISGYELFTIIKAKHKDIPIFAQTAYVMQEDIEKMNKIGFDEIITKPIDFYKFLDAIDKALK